MLKAGDQIHHYIVEEAVGGGGIAGLVMEYGGGPNRGPELCAGASEDNDLVEKP